MAIEKNKCAIVPRVKKDRYKILQDREFQNDEGQIVCFIHFPVLRV